MEHTTVPPVEGEPIKGKANWGEHQRIYKRADHKAKFHRSMDWCPILGEHGNRTTRLNGEPEGPTMKDFRASRQPRGEHYR